MTARFELMLAIVGQKKAKYVDLVQMTKLGEASLVVSSEFSESVIKQKGTPCDIPHVGIERIR